MSNRLTILGASVRAAAFSALRAGYQPYAIDLFADRDLTAVCTAAKIVRYPGDFLAALAGTPDAPWIYTGGLENHPRLIERLAAIRTLLGNRGAAVSAVRDPHRLAKAATAADCLFPATSREPLPSPSLLKPRRGSGGKRVRMAAAGAAPARRGEYFQQFVPGQAASAVYVGAGSWSMLLGVTRQLVGQDFGLPWPLAYAGSIWPLELTRDQVERIWKLGEVLVRSFGLRGLFNVDFIIHREGVWVLEVNPRYSASVEILERILPGCPVQMHVEACQTAAASEFVRRPGSSVSVGKAVVYAERDGRVPPAFDELVAGWNRAAGRPGIADLPRIGQSLAAGDPVATVFAEGGSAQAVEAELRSRVAGVLNVLATGY